MSDRRLEWPIVSQRVRRRYWKLQLLIVGLTFSPRMFESARRIYRMFIRVRRMYLRTSSSYSTGARLGNVLNRLLTRTTLR